MSALPVAPTAPSAARDSRVRPAREVGAKELRTEVVVVGTGAGGAVAGTELARAGKRVLFLEAGGGFSPLDFQRRSMMWSTRHLYQSRAVQLAMGQPPILVPQGRCVGGSTVLNSGICFRPPKERLEEYAALLDDERWGPEAMGPTVEEIWRRVGVAPTHPGIGRRNNLVLRQGLERIGLPHAWMDRNAPGCVGCGVCHLGCPSGGKASVDKSILPEALNHGAEVLTRAQVREILVEGGRATGVIAAVLDPATDRPVGELTVRADRVLLAASALRTPLLLEGAGLGGEHVGRHLALHPGLGALAEFEEPVMMWDGVPQGYYGKDPDNPRITFETANVGPGELHAMLGTPGRKGAERARLYPHLALAGVMLRDDGEGTVALGGGGPSIRYDLSASDVDAFKRGLRKLVAAYFAAGARRVAPLVHPLTFYEREADALAAVDGVEVATDFARVHASHPHGTCRMGPAEGEHAGVCDENGQVHGTPELYVVDGSLFPTTLGVNPQIAIMSFALAVARRMG